MTKAMDSAKLHVEREKLRKDLNLKLEAGDSGELMGMIQRSDVVNKLDSLDAAPPIWPNEQIMINGNMYNSQEHYLQEIRKNRENPNHKYPLDNKTGGPRKYQMAGALNYSTPALSGYAGPSGGMGSGNVGLNFNPKLNMGYASNQGENASDVTKLGNLQVGANLGLNTRQNTAGMTVGYTQPLAAKGFGRNLVASGNAHMGAPLNNKGDGAFGDFSTGLGYYNNSGNTYGVKGTLGANLGATGHRAGQGGYGEIQGNYGALSAYGGRGGQGNYGGIGVNIPMNLRKKQTGGMYGDNTMSAAGQGVPQLGMSSTIVGQETDPALQEQRMQGLNASTQGLNSQSDQMIQQTRAQEGIDQQLTDQAGQQELNRYSQQNDAMAGTIGQVGQFIGNKTSNGNAPGPGGWGEAWNVGKNAYNLSKAANLANDASTMSEAAQLATDAGGWIGSSADAAQTGTMILDASGNAVQAGSTLANTASAIGSAVPWGTVMNYAGKGLTALSDDNDATHSNAGEYGGKMLQRAGQGATVGSFFPGPGTAIGAGIGAVVGGIEQKVGTNKARNAEDKYEQDARTARNEGIYDLNKNVSSLYGSHMSNMAAGNMAQKTVSGQNLGRNVMYKHGGANQGMMMKMPRYGYKS